MLRLIRLRLIRVFVQNRMLKYCAHKRIVERIPTSSPLKWVNCIAPVCTVHQGGARCCIVVCSWRLPGLFSFDCLKYDPPFHALD